MWTLIQKILMDLDCSSLNHMRPEKLEIGMISTPFSLNAMIKYAVHNYIHSCNPNVLVMRLNKGLYLVKQIINTWFLNLKTNLEGQHTSRTFS